MGFWDKVLGSGGLVDRMLGNEDVRFYQLVLESLAHPTDGTEHGIKSFKFDEASSYAYTYVNTDYFEILDNRNTVRIPYYPRRLDVKDLNHYKVVIRENYKGLAEFESFIDNEL